MPKQKAKHIKLLIADVDGVLTDGKIYLDANGQETKGFHSQDGIGIKLLQHCNITFAVISGRSATCVTKRLTDLDVSEKYIYQQQSNKIEAFEKIMRDLSLSESQVAFIGDDIPDMPLIMRVGLGIAVPNAPRLVQRQADWCTTKKGGEGALREACDFILTAQDLLDKAIAKYF